MASTGYLLVGSLLLIGISLLLLWLWSKFCANENQNNQHGNSNRNGAYQQVNTSNQHNAYVGRGTSSLSPDLHSDPNTNVVSNIELTDVGSTNVNHSVNEDDFAISGYSDVENELNDVSDVSGVDEFTVEDKRRLDIVMKMAEKSIKEKSRNTSVDSAVSQNSEMV